jgi:hypothetical protein
MGRPARNRPALLPNKLLAIREILTLRRVGMAERLQAQILSHSGKEYRIKGGRISEWESGRREPDMLVLLAYSRLAHVSMNLMVEDAISVDAFREQLAKELKRGRKAQHKKKKVKKRLNT